MKGFLIALSLCFSLQAIEFSTLEQHFLKIEHPFSHDLAAKTFQGNKEDCPVVLCLHGYGQNWQYGAYVHQQFANTHHLISFNFPDHDIEMGTRSPKKITYGTPNEILPPLYLINECLKAGCKEIHLYGFSAGGGATINILCALNTNRFDPYLKKIGIEEIEKAQILSAIKNGSIILNCPLKSIDEILETRPSCHELMVIQERAHRYQLNPIDNLFHLHPLELDITLHFQEKDEAVSNLYDPLYIERIKLANKLGNTSILIGNDGGHMVHHATLWDHLECKAALH